MKVQLEQILQNLFQKSSLEEVDVTELGELVKEHPYFSTGHFLLAQKLKQQDDDQADLQSQKAVLYFHDPLWLQWQSKKFVNGHAVEDVQPEIQRAEVMPVQMPMEAEEVVEAQPRDWEEPREQEEELKEQEQPVEDEEALEPQEELAVETIGPVEEAIPADAVAEEEITEPDAEPAPEIEASIEQPPAPEQKASEPSKPVIQPEVRGVLSFDAYYTIDYFASQGIKPPAEVQPGDKLGKQLKSFTEWLKTMKRLPQAQVEEKADDTEQQHIRQVAAHSLEQKEVVTETMAEVLAKQDRNTEAIAIYEKLSLLDPSKSAYFAAKIENLKAN